MSNSSRIFLNIAIVFTIATQNQALAQTQSFTEVDFGSVRYHLPAETYRIWAQKYDPKKDRAAFGFSAIAPNVDPASADPNESANWGRGTGWHKEIHILFEYGYIFGTAQQSFDRAIKNSLLMKKMQDTDERNGKRVVRFRYLDPEQFEVMVNGCKKYEGFAIAGDETLMCPTKDGLVYVACHPEKGTTLPNGKFWKWFPYCDVHVNVGERSALTYSFGYEFISDFPEMHRTPAARHAGSPLAVSCEA